MSVNLLLKTIKHATRQKINIACAPWLRLTNNRKFKKILKGFRKGFGENPFAKKGFPNRLSPLYPIQSLLNVGDEVVCVFKSAGKANEVGTDSRRDEIGI